MIADVYAPAFEVRISGLTLAADVTEQVVSLTYDNNLDLADMFSLVLRNPDNRLLDSAVFDLGRTVEIHMGYAGELEPMMLGEITAIEPSFPESGAPTTRVTGYDRSHRMRSGQGERQFQWVPDSVIAAQIAAEAGLVPVVDPSPIFHRKKITQSGSDMAFLKERARANFFDVYVRWDKLFFQFPRPQVQAVVLEWGRNLSSYEPRISAAGLAGVQVVRGYSEELAQTIVALAAGPDLLDFDTENLLERLGTAAADLLLSFGRSVLRTHAVESPVDAAVLAQSLLKELLEGMYEGRGTCVGLPALRAGSTIEVRGVGRRFSGTYRLRKVTHTIGESGYRTTFEVTQRSGGVLLSLLRRTLQENPSPNHREPYFGVAVAKVEANGFDPTDGPPMAKVKVSYPWLSDKVESGWARCASPMTGRDAGLYLLPSRGDEVLVAFEHGDLSRPVIIGGLWNGPNPPPVVNVDGRNAVRMLRTPGGHSVTLDDTPLTGGVTVEAKGGTKIVLAADGSVSITAATTLALKAQTVSIDAKTVDVKVATTMNVHG